MTRHPGLSLVSKILALSLFQDIFIVRMEDGEEDITVSERGVSEDARNVSGGTEDRGQRNKFLDAEEYKKVIASLLPAWKRDRNEISGLYCTWPQTIDSSTKLEGSSVTDEPATKRSCREKVKDGRRHRDDSDINCDDNNGNKDVVESSKVSGGERDREYGLIMEAEEAMNIPALPYPQIEGVSEDIIKSVLKSQKRCGACPMCIKDKGHRNFKCQALAAVVAWEKEMGAIDGALVFQIAQKLGELTDGHGMRQGKGLRCGRCKTCCVECPDKMCLTTIAVRDGTLPDRLKPAAMGVSYRKNTLRSVTDPYSIKPSGFEMLKERFTPSCTTIGNEVVEYKRWGVANLSYAERNRVKDLVEKGKKKIKFQKKWKCLSPTSTGIICGKSNREGVKVCHACKSLRWLGPEGQVESRVAAILDRGMVETAQDATLCKNIRDIIIKEHGNTDVLPDECVSLDAIQDAVSSYQEAKDAFKVNLARRNVSLRLMHLQDTMDTDVLEAGRIVKDSAFGKAVADFDRSLMGYIRQRGAQKQIEAARQSGYSVNQAENLLDFVDLFLRDIEYIVHLMYGFIDIGQKLESLKSCLLDWGTEPEWLGALKDGWKCKSLRKQMAIIVCGSYMFTIKSMLAYFIHRILMKTDGRANEGCKVCAVDHSIYIPSWRISPILVQMSDRVHDITPRVMDDESFCFTGEEDPLRSVCRDVRYPMYRLVEATLNQAALQEASERIPVKHRPNPPSRFVESTKISSFPALPVDALDWYEKESMWLGETPEDDLISKCIPDGKVDTNALLSRMLKKKNGRRNRKPCKPVTSSYQGSEIESAFLPYGVPGSQPNDHHLNDSSASNVFELLKSLPREVQFVFRAAQQNNVLSSVALEESILKFNAISNRYGRLPQQRPDNR